MNLRNIDSRAWVPRLAWVFTAVFLYVILVYSGLVPLDPVSWLLDVGDRVRAELPRYGALAPIVYIAFYALQIVLAPLPGAALAYTAGYLFGPVLAPIYSMIGILIGSALGFVAARRLGWPIVEKMAPTRWIERWRSMATVNSGYTWFLVFLAPTADVFYFIAGLTTLSFRRFMGLVLLGRTPGIILSSVLGANIETFGAQWIIVLIAAMLLISVAGHYMRDWIKRRALTQSTDRSPSVAQEQFE
jgi:uncharacterized membrane protein YdjX (TVP38/TMEM64 family)